MARRGGALVVFAKQPLPGLVKTRLCPPLTPEQAAGFYAAMLADVLDTSARLARTHGLTPFLALHAPDGLESVACPEAFRVEAQRGADLAGRMTHACEARFAEGFAPVLLRGSDSPTLSDAVVAAALAALEGHDLVACPDRDGGYNLVGLARPIPGVFDHRMSTASVLSDTLARAHRAGARTATLPAGFDLDSVADLELLQAARHSEEAGECPRTLAWLDAHPVWRLVSSGQGSAHH